MADNWRVLDFSSFEGELRFNKNKNSLTAIYRETGEVVEQPASDINIVFIGISVGLAPSAVYHLAKNDIVVLFCDWKGLPISGMYPWIDAHGRVAARQRAQAALGVPRAKNAWMRIVKAKIRGQARNLEFLGLDGADVLRQLSAKVRSGDPSNIEGQAAKAYWKSLFGKDFRRMPGDSDDPRNSFLNYGYTILRGHSMRAVLSAGLTPALGLYHRNRSNAFALADDLIEPFRAVIDREAYRLVGAPSMNREVRGRMLKAAGDVFNMEGWTVPTVMRSFAQQYGRYVEGDVEFLDVPVWEL